MYRENANELKRKKEEGEWILHTYQQRTRKSDAYELPFLRYLESRSIGDQSAEELNRRNYRGEKIGILEVKDIQTAKDLENIIKRNGVVTVMCQCMGRDSIPRTILMFGEGDTSIVKEARELYFLLKRIQYQTSRDMLERYFAQNGISHTYGLDYATAFFLKERADYNGILYSMEADHNGKYTCFTQKDDQKNIEILLSGIRQERMGNGKHIFEQYNAHQKSLEHILGMVAVNKEKKLIIYDEHRKRVIKTEKDGIYFNHSGRNEREYVSRNDDIYLQKLYECLDRIKVPTIQQVLEDGRIVTINLDERGNSLVDEKNENSMRQKVLKREEIHSSERKNNEIHAMVKRSIDLLHTKEEGVSYQTPNEKEIFEAEHEIYLNYEFGLIHGAESIKNKAEQYIGGNIVKDEIFRFNPSYAMDIRSSLEWRRPYDLPTYLDRNGDKILDDHQKWDEKAFDQRSYEHFERNESR